MTHGVDVVDDGAVDELDVGLVGTLDARLHLDTAAGDPHRQVVVYRLVGTETD